MINHITALTTEELDDSTPGGGLWDAGHFGPEHKLPKVT